MRTATRPPLLVEEPATEEERFGLYVLRGGVPRRIATAPDAAGIGEALVRIAEEREQPSAEPVGILDRIAHRWLWNLWTPKGETA